MQNLHKLKDLRRKMTTEINLNPLQRGGILSPDVKQMLHEWGDGYSICDFCDGRLDYIRNPPIFDFVHELLPHFLGVDIARVTNGARESKDIVIHAICKPGDTMVIDQNAHYTTYLAAERNGVKIREVHNNKYPEYRIDPESYVDTIVSIEKETGGLPSLVLLTYPDGNYGNLVDAKRIAQIAQDFRIPFLLNAAYAIGRMPLSATQIGCDFIVGSGHKSMAASGPIGVLGMTEEFSEQVLRTSRYANKKEVELLGCTARGASILTMMASFPYVLERITHWDQEVTKARWFSHEAEKLGLTQLGDRPHGHDLVFFESNPFFQISRKHPKKRYFLYNELKKRGISGIKTGLTKFFKLSTYQLSYKDLKQVLVAFSEIITENQKYLH